MITSDKWLFYNEDEFEIRFKDKDNDNHYISFYKAYRYVEAWRYVDYESISLDLTIDDIKFINRVLNKMGWLDEA